jgi:hypothetical protein
MNRLIPLAGLTFLTAAPLAGQGIVGRNDQTFTLSESVSDGGWVRISTMNGRVDVSQGTGGRVEISAAKVIRRGSVEDIGFVVRKENGGITICAVWDEEDECGADGSYRGRNRPRGWSNDHQGQANFTVRIPAGIRLRAASGNGAVNVAGASIEVIAATGNGEVTVREARGPVEAASGNGDIRVITANGPVTASTGNGEIDVSIAKLDRSPDMSFSTGNGSVTVRLPEGYGAEVEATTGNGHVSSDFPITMRGGRLDRTRLRGTIGNGGGKLSISSGNGDVEIKKQ